MHLAFRLGSEHFSIDVQRSADARFTVSVNGAPETITVDLLAPTTLRMTIDGRAHMAHVVRVAGTVHVALEGVSYALEPDTPVATGEVSVFANPLVVAPMPGKVLKVLVAGGQRVAAGDTLLILEAMKMETRIRAEGPGTIQRVFVEEGEMVDGGELLIELEPVE
jgi:3-methylcrotonyl-CoA carboxylase alpha subunit